VDDSDAGSFQPARYEKAARTGGDINTSPGPDVVTVLLSSLRPGESPRLKGEDQAHIKRLAAIEAPLPPVLVDRRTMRIIDGMHRLLAASLSGRHTIEVIFFDGSPTDTFLRAVEANMTHGLPLSQADRQAAAQRIIESHPHLSDRAIAQVAGLAAKTVAGIRRRSTNESPPLGARVGKDGKARPLSSFEGRQRAGELIAKHPRASLREVARGAGVSPATVLDVRRRLERGEGVGPGRPDAASSDPVPASLVRLETREEAETVRQAPAARLDTLLREPLLRHNGQGRRLLRWLRGSHAGVAECAGMLAAVPPHCAAMVAQLARHNARMWLEFAQEVDDHVRDTGPRAHAGSQDRVSWEEMTDLPGEAKLVPSHQPTASSYEHEQVGSR
jgi:ParB-like chromosome segregation protein Spo0J